MPLRDLADIDIKTGPALIYREHHGRYIAIKFAVRGRDLAGAVAEAQRQVAERVTADAAGRLRARLGRRVQADARSQRPPGDHHPAVAAADPGRPLRRFQLGPRRLAGVDQRDRPVAGGDLGAVPDPYAVQRVGGGGLHLDLRRGGAGRHLAGVVLQAAPGRRAAAARGRSCAARNCDSGR